MASTQIPVQPVVMKDWRPLPWKSLLPWGRGCKGFANCPRTQTFTMPQGDVLPCPVLPLRWLSAADAAEGGAQLPPASPRGMGTPELPHTPGAGAAVNPIPLLRSPCGGTSGRGKHLNLGEEGSSQATPGMCSGCIFALDSQAGTALATENHHQGEDPAQLQPQSQPSPGE